MSPGGKFVVTFLQCDKTFDKKSEGSRILCNEQILLILGVINHYNCGSAAKQPVMLHSLTEIVNNRAENPHINSFSYSKISYYYIIVKPVGVKCVLTKI